MIGSTCDLHYTYSISENLSKSDFVLFYYGIYRGQTQVKRGIRWPGIEVELASDCWIQVLNQYHQNSVS